MLQRSVLAVPKCNTLGSSPRVTEGGRVFGGCPHPNPPPKEGGSSALPWARPCPFHHPNPLPLPGGGQGGGQPQTQRLNQNLSPPSQSPLSSPPVPLWTARSTDGGGPGRGAGRRCPAWVVALYAEARGSVRNDRCTRMGSFSHNRKIPASRGGNASFSVPETLSLRDPSTFSTRRKPAGRFRAAGYLSSAGSIRAPRWAITLAATAWACLAASAGSMPAMRAER